MIADIEICCADPAAVVEQYEPYIMKLANRYTNELRRTGAVDFDDLVQVGRIATLDAQQKYNPDKGSFMNCLFYYVRCAMRRALGMDNQSDSPPVILLSLDEPLSDDSETTRGDILSDPDALPVDESIIEDETRTETARQIREAVERMQSEKQREIITRIWFDGQKREDAAAEMGIKPAALRNLDITARQKLKRDWRLKRFVRDEVPLFSVGIREFNTTWISATEKAVFWRESNIFSKQSPEEQNAPE